MDEEDKLFGRAGRQRSFMPTLGPDDQNIFSNVVRLYSGAEPRFANAFRRLAREWIDDGESLDLRALLLLVADLADQGWRIRPAGDRFVFEPPGLAKGDGDVEAVKARVQKSLQIPRNRQLQEPSVRAFIRRMERSSPRIDGRMTSIADVIDDGDDLADDLARIRALPDEKQAAALKRVVDPVIEVCDAKSRCADTGLPLIDIWRYFRHTWSHEYRSIPGRQMMVLVRNAARRNRPVMGIAMLASPVMRLHARDMWIGWLRPAVEARIAAGELDPRQFVHAMTAQLDKSIANIRWDDLADATEIANPTEQAVFRLQQKAYGAAYKRELELKAKYGAGSDAKAPRDLAWPKNAEVDWKSASEDLLFVRKRAESLAELLFSKMIFSELGPDALTKDGIAPHFAIKRSQRAIDIALAEYRKVGLSSQIADVSICGAVHPYNDLLGGKLVALMLTSREMREAYAKRYGGQVSLIASQMAGRPITKPAELRILTTTSLYGLGSSQYNRLGLKAAEHWGIPHDIRWKAIATSNGYGTLHLGADTLHALRHLSERRHDARRINNRFGEGTSPRLRQVREGLDVLGIQSDQILHHATPRIFYGCELDPDASKGLLEPRDRARKRAPSQAAIGEAWRRRWLLGRIANSEIDVIGRIRRLGAGSVRAILHPDLAEGEADQLELFDEI